MHELSIISSIVDTAQKYAVENGAKKVKKISVLAGEMSGVLPYYLNYYFPKVIKDMPLFGGCVLDARTEEIRLMCKTCKTQYKPAKTDYACPKCKSTDCKIISGKDVKILNIEIILDETEQPDH